MRDVKFGCINEQDSAHWEHHLYLSHLRKMTNVTKK